MTAGDHELTLLTGDGAGTGSVVLPLFPDAHVTITGDDASYEVIAKVRTALAAAGATLAELAAFSREATSGDRARMMVACARWADVS